MITIVRPGQTVHGSTVAILPEVNVNQPPRDESFGKTFQSQSLVGYSLTVNVGSAVYEGMLILPPDVSIDDAINGGVR